jgi:hypothetical protein
MMKQLSGKSIICISLILSLVRADLVYPDPARVQTGEQALLDDYTPQVRVLDQDVQIYDALETDSNSLDEEINALGSEYAAKHTGGDFGFIAKERNISQHPQQAIKDNFEVAPDYGVPVVVTDDLLPSPPPIAPTQYNGKVTRPVPTMIGKDGQPLFEEVEYVKPLKLAQEVEKQKKDAWKKVLQNAVNETLNAQAETQRPTWQIPLLVQLDKGTFVTMDPIQEAAPIKLTRTRTSAYEQPIRATRATLGTAHEILAELGAVRNGSHTVPLMVHGSPRMPGDVQQFPQAPQREVVSVKSTAQMPKRRRAKKILEEAKGTNLIIAKNALSPEITVEHLDRE